MVYRRNAGPDGHLYISVGDGGGGGDPLGAGQSLETLLGKLLRIEPWPGETPPYAIPPGNPFAADEGRSVVLVAADGSSRILKPELAAR